MAPGSSLQSAGFSSCGAGLSLSFQQVGLVAPWHLESYFSDQGLNPSLPELEGRFLATGPPGKSQGLI